MKLEVTQEKVLAAAASCTTANNVLRAMFPEAFIIKEYPPLKLTNNGRDFRDVAGSKIALNLVKPAVMVGNEHMIHYMSLYGKWHVDQFSASTIRLYKEYSSGDLDVLKRYTQNKLTEDL